MAATCAVCGSPCRGTCKKCGARVCYLHAQPTQRSRCAVCRTGTTVNLSAPAPVKQPRQARSAPAPRGSPSRMVPVYVPPKAPKKPIEDMSPEEALAMIADIRARLLAKQRRERDYLDRRAARGTHTSTDDAYEQDQLLEDEIITLIDALEGAVRKDFGL